MKYLFISIAIILSINCKTTVINSSKNNISSNQQLDSLGILFKQVDYSKYIGKTIEELLQVAPLNRTPIVIGTFGEPAHSLSYTKLVYSKEVFVLLYPDTENLKYVNRYSATLIWDFNLIKKEKISRIRVFTDDVEMVFSKDYVKKFSH
jgi:hypothetical protein